MCVTRARQYFLGKCLRVGRERNLRQSKRLAKDQSTRWTKKRERRGEHFKEHPGGMTKIEIVAGTNHINSISHTRIPDRHNNRQKPINKKTDTNNFGRKVKKHENNASTTLKFG